MLLLLPLALAACDRAPTETTEANPTATQGEETEDAGGTDDVSLAVTGAPEIAAAARRRLRARGPEGLAALLDAHTETLTALAEGTAPPNVEALRDALDTVAAQRDAHASGLYWHTDLDAAKREAARLGRPILSLRLLGRLDEELSCANSRYFRTVLYPDARVGELLRDRFVLHWSSERPAPRVTIDMGDGRQMVRTLTGNSVHYVLDAEGRVLDAIPGLYAPLPFRGVLEAALGTAERCAADADADACVRRAHADALTSRRAAWDANATTLGAPSFDALLATTEPPTVDFPSALDAMPLTIGKAAIEVPMLDVLARRPTPRPRDDVDWDRVAGLGARFATMQTSEATVALVALKTGTSLEEARPLARRLVGTAFVDGTRNENVLHPRVHLWLADEAAERGFEAFNARLYRELFLTPADDPWLGLRDPNVWDAIEDVEAP
ncbi:MAG: hypothetical protein KC586_10595 [Myxococcales bacterium]|nr:hypothetical protein [Myxococcales bacterium]